MAEHQQHYEFAATDNQQLLAERQASWDGFVQVATWTIVATVLLLLGLLVFVA